MTGSTGQVSPEFWGTIIAALEVRHPHHLLNPILLQRWQQNLDSLVNMASPPGTWLLALFQQKNAQGQLVVLLQSIKARSQDPWVRKAIDEALGPLANIRSEWYNTYMPMDMPFINRMDLREKLYDVLERKAEHKHLMIIRGEGWGKSYSRWLVQHAARNLGFRDPIYVDLLESQSVEEISEILVSEFGFSFNAFKERFTTPV